MLWCGSIMMHCQLVKQVLCCTFCCFPAARFSQASCTYTLVVGRSVKKNCCHYSKVISGGSSGSCFAGMRSSREFWFLGFVPVGGSNLPQILPWYSLVWDAVPWLFFGAAASCIEEQRIRKEFDKEKLHDAEMTHARPQEKRTFFYYGPLLREFQNESQHPPAPHKGEVTFVGSRSDRKPEKRNPCHATKTECKRNSNTLQSDIVKQLYR